MKKCDKIREKYLVEWKKFMATGQCDQEIIRPVILDSWKRCRKLGLDPMNREKFHIESQDQFASIVHKNSSFISFAKPYMDILTTIVNNTGFFGLLADKHGNVLTACGEAELVKSAENDFIQPGSIRREDVAGTTAIALCLLTKQPVQIFAAEHFHCCYHDWTCCAAPVCDESGELVGILNVSGDYRFMHKHTLGIVIGLTKAMEHALKLIFINAYMLQSIDMYENGMIVLDSKFNVQYVNKKMMHYLSSANTEFIGKNIDNVIISEPHVSTLISKNNYLFEKSITVAHNNTSTILLLNTQTVHGEKGEHIGSLLVTKEKKDIHRLVNRMVGAYATFTFDDIIGANAQLLQAIKYAHSVAATNARVLIQGESGTGKELFAQAIHNASAVKDGPFIGINCSAIPAELMESELFGYAEGAFSGAKKGGMPGKFELADGGTIFFDEINSMPQAMQIKLLRVLEENKVTRVGGTTVLPVNVRVLAASGKNLAELVDQGHMRLDLYYRINTVIIDIPPLRERKDDIPTLVHHVVPLACVKLGLKQKSIADDFMDALQHHTWPGNIRELVNVIERTLIIAQDAETITLNHLNVTNFAPGPVPTHQTPERARFAACEVRPLREVEQELITKALTLCENNSVAAAKMLGIHRNTLANKLKEYKRSPD